MKHYYIAALGAGLSLLTGCINIGGWRTVQGDGQITTENRSVSQFDQVTLATSGDLELTQGDQESLSIQTDENLLPLIRSEVRNGKLLIETDNVNLRPSRTVLYRLQVKNLTGLHLSGSGRVHADSLKTDRLSVSISGSGQLELSHLEAESLASHISGSGSIKIAGQVDRQEIQISGSGDHHGGELRSARAKAGISGSGNASLWVTESLRAHISGSGRIEYRGDADVDSHISGSGRVRRLSDAR